MPHEPSSQEVLDAVLHLGESIQGLATHVDDRFLQVDARFTGIDQQLKEMRATIVTKSYLDDKLADLRGDLVVLARKGNVKLQELVEELERRHVLDRETAHRILMLEPFPQT